MSSRLLVAALVSLLSAVVARADPEADATLKKALAAHGGAEALKKALTCQRREVGAAFEPKKTEFESETTYNLPERFRLVLKIKGGLEIVNVLSGDKGWIKAFATVPMVPERVAELREEVYVAWIALLVPLLDKSFTLTAVPGTKVDKEATVAIKASRKGMRDTTLYFSAKSGLLVKVARRTLAASVLVNKEYLFREHKVFEDARLPTREVHLVNKNVTTELEIKGYRFARGPLDPKLFEKP